MSKSLPLLDENRSFERKTFRPGRGSIKVQSRPATVDMTARQWGELTAVRKGGPGYWWFRCPAGHENLLNATHIRRAMALHEEGKLWMGGKKSPAQPRRCPTCLDLEKK